MPFYINDLYNLFIPQTNATKFFLVHLIQAKSHATSKKGKLCSLSTMTKSNIKMAILKAEHHTNNVSLQWFIKKKNPISKWPEV